MEKPTERSRNAILQELESIRDYLDEDDAHTAPAGEHIPVLTEAVTENPMNLDPSESEHSAEEQEILDFNDAPESSDDIDDPDYEIRQLRNAYKTELGADLVDDDLEVAEESVPELEHIYEDSDVEEAETAEDDVVDLLSPWDDEESEELISDTQAGPAVEVPFLETTVKDEPAKVRANPLQTSLFETEHNQVTGVHPAIDDAILQKAKQSNEQILDRSALKSGENPFLPPHIRKQLGQHKGVNSELQKLSETTLAQSHLLRDKAHQRLNAQRPRSDKPLSEDEIHQLIDQTIEEFLPRIEYSLRMKLQHKFADKK